MREDRKKREALKEEERQRELEEERIRLVKEVNTIMIAWAFPSNKGTPPMKELKHVRKVKCTFA